ncbi:Copia protein, partial [Mucuna pruriens]
MQDLRTPIEQNHRIRCEESPIIEKSQYQRLLGKLIYLSHTRSDIAYDVSVVSQFMHDPRKRHLQAVERILQYLKASTAMSIAHNPVQHDRTKHIEIDRHFIKEKLDNGLIVTTHIPIGPQVIDVFTKGLLAIRFQELNDHKCTQAWSLSRMSLHTWLARACSFIVHRTHHLPLKMVASHSRSMKIGFGNDNSRDTYKVVAMVVDRESLETELRVHYFCQRNVASWSGFAKLGLTDGQYRESYKYLLLPDGVDIIHSLTQELWFD